MLAEESLSEPTAIGARYLKRKREPLDFRKKLDIAHKVLVGKLFQADVAKEYGVSQGVVSQIITKIKKDPEKLSELLSRQHEKQNSETLLAETVQC